MDLQWTSTRQDKWIPFHTNDEISTKSSFSCLFSVWGLVRSNIGAYILSGHNEHVHNETMRDQNGTKRDLKTLLMNRMHVNPLSWHSICNLDGVKIDRNAFDFLLQV